MTTPLFKKTTLFTQWFILVALLAGLFSCLNLQAQAFPNGDYEQALSWYQKQNYKVAVFYFKKAARTEPNNANIYYYLGDTYIKLNRLNEAEKSYQQVLSIAPHSQAARLSTLALSNLKNYRQQQINYGNGSIAHNASVGHSSQTHAGAGKKLAGFNPKGDDYLKDILDAGMYIRWDLSSMPLKIYVERSPKNISNFRPSFIDKVYKATEIWTKATNGQITFMRVDDPVGADIRVVWTDTIDTRGTQKGNKIVYTAGTTSPAVMQDQLQYMEVKLATRDISGQPQNDTNIYPVAIHELGHAMGLLGHSKVGADMMSPVSHGSDQLTQRDLNTLHRLYMMDADVTNIPPDKNDKDRNTRLASQLDDSIERMEALTEQDKTALNFLNLGSAYYRKALQLYQKNPANNDASDTNGSVYWYRRALAAYEVSLDKEPMNATAYSKIAYVSHDMGNYAKALEQASKAISLDPNNADFYFQRAGILVKTGDKVKAQNDLKTFLNFNPGFRDSREVQSLTAQIDRL